MSKQKVVDVYETDLVMYDMSEVVARMGQIQFEDVSNVRGIRAAIRKDIVTNMDGMFGLIFEHCIKQIQEYKTKDGYWDSKQERVDALIGMSNEDIALDLFSAVIRTAAKRVPIQVVASAFSATLEYANPFDGIRTAAEILGACVETGLYSIWNDPLVVMSHYELPQHLAEQLEFAKYPNPMLVTPDRWKNNYTGGYITLKQHCVLKGYNNHNEQQALDALNIAQSVTWKIDVRTECDAATGPLINEYEELRQNGTQEDFDAFVLKNRMTAQTLREISRSKFNFVYRYDSRGRMYSQGYYINHQSDEYRKAMLEFEYKQVIT